MTSDIKTSLDNEEAEPMRAEVFEIAAGAVSFHGAHLETPRIVQAARAVLVDSMPTGKAATLYGFPPERVSEAVGRIRDKWNAICTERGWVTETFSLSPHVIELIKLIEQDTLEPLRAEQTAKRKKKAPAKPPKKKAPLLTLVDGKKPRKDKSKKPPPKKD